MAIGTTNHKMVLDATEFKRGATMARHESRALGRAMRETQTPVEGLGKTLGTLEKAMARGVGGEAVAQAVDRLRAKIAASSEATKEANAMSQRAAEIRDRWTTAEQRATAAAEEARKLRDADILSQDEYLRRMKDIAQTLPSVIARKQELADAERDAARVINRLTTDEERLSQDRARADDLLKRKLLTEQQYEQELKRINSLMPEAIEAERKRTEAQQHAARITRQSETATEKYERELEELNAAMREGGLKADVYRRHMDRLNRELREGHGRSRDFRQGLGEAIPVVGRMNSTIALGHPALIAAAVATVGVTVALRGLRTVAYEVSEGVGSAMGRIDETAKTAAKIGSTTEDLVSLRLAAAEFSGMASGQVDMALQRFTRRMAEASRGTGEAKDAIKELGLDAKELSKAGVGEAFKRVSERFQEIQDPAQRLRLAFKLFDSEGAALATTLMAGRDGLEDMERKAAALGLAFNKVDASKVESANDAFGEAKAAIDGVYNSLAVDLAPALEVGANLFGAYTWAMKSAVSGGTSLSNTLAMVTGHLSDHKNVIEGMITFDFEKVGRGVLGENARRANAIIDAMNERKKKEGQSSPGLDMELPSTVGGSEAGSIESLTASLREQVDVLQMGKDAVERRKAASAGATEEELQELDRLHAKKLQLAEAEKERAEFTKKLEKDSADGARTQEQLDREDFQRKMKYQDEIKNKRKQETDQVLQALKALRTPQQQVNDQIKEYSGWLDKALISTDEFKKLSEEARREASKPIQMGGIEAAVAGSLDAMLRLDRQKELIKSGQLERNLAATFQTDQKPTSNFAGNVVDAMKGGIAALDKAQLPDFGKAKNFGRDMLAAMDFSGLMPRTPDRDPPTMIAGGSGGVGATGPDRSMLMPSEGPRAKAPEQPHRPPMPEQTGEFKGGDEKLRQLVAQLVANTSGLPESTLNLRPL